MDDKLLTFAEVTAYLKIPKSNLYKLCEKKQIPCFKIGKHLRFKQSSLEAWLTQKESGAANQAHAKKLLLIEDDQLVLKAISRLLTSHGYAVETAENGEEALVKAKTLNFDLVITDIRMPGIDGIETIKRIRQLYEAQNRPKVPEIIITGYTDGRPELEAERLGIRDYLYKPFATDDFINTVKKNLSFAPGLN